MLRRTIKLLLAAVAVTFAMQAQTREKGMPAFEVASIKACKNDAAGGPGGRRGGADDRADPADLYLPCRTVSNLIHSAYDFYADGKKKTSAIRLPLPIEGGPAWIDSERYTIRAKPENRASQEMMIGPMLEALLEDRFKLKIRRQTKEVPVYALILAKGGAKLKPFREGSCVNLADGPPPRTGEEPILCGVNTVGGQRGPNVTLDVRGISLDEFAQLLNVSGAVDRPVVNRTGITGKFDLHLEHARDGGGRGPLPNAGEPAGAVDGAADGASFPSIFTALQQQLGLKLEASKGGREFLVIDHVERPSEN